MSWQEEMNNTKKVLKNGTPQEKAEYIWEYYKVPILIFLFLLFIIGSLIHSKMTAKDYLLHGVFLNSLAESSTVEEFENDYLSEHPIDTQSEDIFFDTSIYYNPDNDTDTTSYQSIQVLSARIAAGELDFMIGELSVLYEHFCYSDYFIDLSEVLTEEQLEYYEPYFLYYDLAVRDELNEIDYLSEEAETIALPDPSKPELMEQPVPVMIDLSSCEELSCFYPNLSDGYVFSLFANAKHLDKTLEFLDYLMK